MKLFTTCFLSLCFSAGIVSGAPMTVTAELMNAGSTNLADQHGNLVGPYTLDVNGVEYAALCVDFKDEGKINYSYSAFETALDGNNFSYTYNPSSATEYKEEAYLMSLILRPNADRIDIQDAAWSITDSQFKAGKAASYYVGLAEANYQTLDFSNFEIISGSTKDCNRPQEFLIAPAAIAPEPASLLLLGGGLLLIGLVRRRKQLKS